MDILLVLRRAFLFLLNNPILKQEVVKRKSSAA